MAKIAAIEEMQEKKREEKQIDMGLFIQEHEAVLKLSRKLEDDISELKEEKLDLKVKLNTREEESSMLMMMVSEANRKLNEKSLLIKDMTSAITNLNEKLNKEMATTKVCYRCSVR